MKNLLKALQQFLSFPTCPGRYEPPKKNATLISSDRKKELNSQNKKCIYSKRNEKQLLDKNTIKG